MKDPRVERLAEILLFHSCGIRPGTRLLIETFDLPDPEIVVHLGEKAARTGALPYVITKHNRVLRTLYQHAGEEALRFCGRRQR